VLDWRNGFDVISPSDGMGLECGRGLEEIEGRQREPKTIYDRQPPLVISLSRRQSLVELRASHEQVCEDRKHWKV
jgi:hypothetical protein